MISKIKRKKKSHKENSYFWIFPLYLLYLVDKRHTQIFIFLFVCLAVVVLCALFTIENNLLSNLSHFHVQFHSPYDIMTLLPFSFHSMRKCSFCFPFMFMSVHVLNIIKYSQKYFYCMSFCVCVCVFMCVYVCVFLRKQFVFRTRFEVYFYSAV